jgi:hypothetical protein
MKVIKLPVSEFVVFEGTAKTGEKAGQPYCFARIDQRIANNASFVGALKEAGAKIVTEGQITSNSAGYEISEE